MAGLFCCPSFSPRHPVHAPALPRRPASCSSTPAPFLRPAVISEPLAPRDPPNSSSHQHSIFPGERFPAWPHPCRPTSVPAEISGCFLCRRQALPLPWGTGLVRVCVGRKSHSGLFLTGTGALKASPKGASMTRFLFQRCGNRAMHPSSHLRVYQ